MTWSQADDVAWLTHINAIRHSLATMLSDEGTTLLETDLYDLKREIFAFIKIRSPELDASHPQAQAYISALDEVGDARMVLLLSC
jgi:hypothetical protein